MNKLAKSSQDTLSKARSLAIEDQKGLDAANRLLVGIRTLKKAIVDYFAEPKKKAKEAHLLIVERERAELIVLDQAEHIIKPKIQSYLDKVEAERKKAEEAHRKAKEERLERERQALEKAQKLRDEGRVQDALDAIDEIEESPESPRVHVPAAPVMVGVHTRTVWKWRVTDLKKVPAAFKMIDSSKVEKYKRENADKLTKQPVPGIEFYQDTTIQARVK